MTLEFDYSGDDSDDDPEFHLPVLSRCHIGTEIVKNMEYTAIV